MFPGSSRQLAPLGTCAALPQFKLCPLERVESLWAPRQRGCSASHSAEPSMGCPITNGPPISTRAAWERWRNSNYPSKVKKKKKKILAWTELDVASIWCSQSRLDGERPPCGQGSVQYQSMVWQQHRTGKASQYSQAFTSGLAFPLWFYDFIPNL